MIICLKSWGIINKDIEEKELIERDIKEARFILD